MIKILLIPLLLSFVSFAVHVLVWRAFRPDRQMLLLLLIYTVVPAVALPLIGRMMFIQYDISSILVLYVLISFSYILTYPAMQANSPSLLMIIAILEAGKKCSQAEVCRYLDSRKAAQIENRAQDLISDRLMRSDGEGRLSLTAAGRLVARTFAFYRFNLLGLEEGRG